MKSSEIILDITSQIENVSWPVINTGASAVLAGVVGQMEVSQWLPKDLIIKRQYQQLAILASYAQKHSPHFAGRLKKANLKASDISTPEGLLKLPLLLRRDIQLAGDLLNCDIIPQSHLPVGHVQTSGSTGEPVKVRKTALNHLMWQANMMREHFWYKRNFKQRVLNIRGSIVKPEMHSSWGSGVELLFKSGEVLSIPITYTAQQQIDEILKFKPGHILSYPNALEGISAKCESDNIKIEGVEHIWCIGETLSKESRHKIEKLFGASVEDDYSSAELGILALQCPDTGLYHVMAESVIIEILNENDQPCKVGEVGKVVVTNLHNFGSPLIRYDINDYAEVGPDCPCGRGLPTIKQIKGRKRNLVKKPDGTSHWPPLTAFIVHSKLPILQFQLIQHSLEDVEVRLVTRTKLSPEDEQNLTTNLHKALGYTFNLNFVYFKEQIPRAKSGKFEDFICKI
jgi:phenylacetate-CoA ligase